MQGAYSLIGLLAWLQFKHFVADYLLQPAWILRGKGNLWHPGGYVHAGLHALGSLPGLVLLAPGSWIAALMVAEFSVHFAIDHLKAIHALRRPADIMTRAFLAAHGADQFLHHLTYVGMLALMC